MKTIGIDLTPLQGPHRMRGVGSVIINFLNNVNEYEIEDISFVAFLYESNADEIIALTGLNKLRHEVRFVQPQSHQLPSIKTFKGLTFIPLRLYRHLKLRLFGNTRLGDLSNIDEVLQFEQNVTPPPIPTTVVAYDLIPYILEKDYLWSYKTARNDHGYSRRGALLAHLRRHRYISEIRTVSRKAHKIIAISEYTKHDFLRYANTNSAKITVIPLGVTKKLKAKSNVPIHIEHYVATDWGDIKRSNEILLQPFLLFVGGVDPRRKLSDLIAAYNILKAQDIDIKLVLAGDTLFGPNSIPNTEVREAILNSSYPEDILLLGFVDDTTRDRLYRQATAFVYPSHYEGFGLPILEAMRYGTPVITYNNSSIKEVAKDAALYAHDAASIANNVLKLMLNSNMKTEYEELSIKQADKFSWKITASSILNLLKRD